MLWYMGLSLRLGQGVAVVKQDIREGVWHWTSCHYLRSFWPRG
jgi:hypothetical protein